MNITTRRPGLTLVELLVVLTILAVMTTIAVQSVGNLADQARYDATQKTLQNIQSAIVGPPNQIGPNASPFVSGFVGDIGRLPKSVDAISDPLRELWDPSSPIATQGYRIQLFGSTNTPSNSTTAFGLLNPPNTPYNSSASNTGVTVNLPCGWRGPYVTLSPGSGGFLRDGWGNPFDCIYQGPAPGYAVTPMTFGQVNQFPTSINIVRSRGADSQADLTAPQLGAQAYNVDQYIPIQTAAPPLVPFTTTFSGSAFGNINVTVFTVTTTGNGSSSVTALGPPAPFADSNGTYSTVRVVLFTPFNGTLQAFLLDSSNINQTTNAPATDLNNFTTKALDFTLAPPGTQVTGAFLNVPVGARAIQAFQFDANKMTVGKRSPLIYLTVPSGGVPAQTLILQ